MGAQFAAIIANGTMLEHINEYKGTVQKGKGQSPFAIFILVFLFLLRAPQRQVQWADKRS